MAAAKSIAGKEKAAPAKSGEAKASEKSAPKKAAGPKAPRRPTLDPETARLLAVRREGDARRPRFTRQASYRYYRIGRDESWRRPRGQQSKQRRHYKYRSTVVSIGFGGPAKTRGLTPTGFRPVVVSTPKEIAALTPATDAAIIARTVGTRRRLVLEEAARKAGVHVLNPISHAPEE
ncbi:MAG TPA: 50S ribosomal protein L32e [Thermoplasmata archaeon]|nr:50S ribosomal protein L32e [Thermoplasmata archaeon]